MAPKSLMSEGTISLNILNSDSGLQCDVKLTVYRRHCGDTEQPFRGWVRKIRHRVIPAVSLEEYSQDAMPPYGASRDVASVQGRLCDRLKGHVGTS